MVLKTAALMALMTVVLMVNESAIPTAYLMVKLSVVTTVALQVGLMARKKDYKMVEKSG